MKITENLSKKRVNAVYRKCLNPLEIKKELTKLCKFQPLNEKDIENWHIKFEQTHPFEDGNGRTGRIIMNLQRLSSGLPLLIIHTGEEQFNYYKWFKEKNDAKN